MRTTILTTAMILTLAGATGAAMAANTKGEVLNLPGKDARNIMVDTDGDGRGDKRAEVVSNISEIRGDVHYARYGVDLDGDGKTDQWVLRAKTIGDDYEVALDSSPGAPQSSAIGESGIAAPMQ